LRTIPTWRIKNFRAIPHKVVPRRQTSARCRGSRGSAGPPRQGARCALPDLMSFTSSPAVATSMVCCADGSLFPLFPPVLPSLPPPGVAPLPGVVAVSPCRTTPVAVVTNCPPYQYPVVLPRGSLFSAIYTNSLITEPFGFGEVWVAVHF
jgi:hypothetical protein